MEANLSASNLPGAVLRYGKDCTMGSKDELYDTSRRRFLQMSGAAIIGVGIIINRPPSIAQARDSLSVTTEKRGLPFSTRREDEILPESEVLYKAYLVPAKSDLLQMGFEETLADKIIYRVIDGGETSIIATKPLYWDLVEWAKQEGQELSAKIRLELNSYRFYLLHAACTFRSHDDSPHPFIRGEMKLTFSNTTSLEEPIVYDMCPAEIQHPSKVKQEFGVSSSLEFKK